MPCILYLNPNPWSWTWNGERDHRYSKLHELSLQVLVGCAPISIADAELVRGVDMRSPSPIEDRAAPQPDSRREPTNPASLIPGLRRSFSLQVQSHLRDGAGWLAKRYGGRPHHAHIHSRQERILC